jgi:hypothetical protein
MNRPLFDRLLARIEHEHWQPDLRRLEQFASTYSMTQDDYAEAWAWVHSLLESEPGRVELLRGYLNDLRRDGAAAPISARLKTLPERPDATLLAHIRRLESGQW